MLKFLILFLRFIGSLLILMVIKRYLFLYKTTTSCLRLHSRNTQIKRRPCPFSRLKLSQYHIQNLWKHRFIYKIVVPCGFASTIYGLKVTFANCCKCVYVPYVMFERTSYIQGSEWLKIWEDFYQVRRLQCPFSSFKLLIKTELVVGTYRKTS